MEKTLSKKDLVNIFIRSNFLLGSFNFERMQSIGFCVALLPALRKLYQLMLNFMSVVSVSLKSRFAR